MNYKLFLDDIRFPSTGDWIIARSMNDAIWYIHNHGIPSFISFDHDLMNTHYIGDTKEQTGYHFAKWFAEYIIDGKGVLPDGFGYYVHSMNPVGADNINKFMKNFLDHMGEQ